MEGQEKEIKPTICSICKEPYLWTLLMPLKIVKDGKIYSRDGLEENKNICSDCLIAEANVLW